MTPLGAWNKFQTQLHSQAQQEAPAELLPPSMELGKLFGNPRNCFIRSTRVNRCCRKSQCFSILTPYKGRHDGEHLTRTNVVTFWSTCHILNPSQLTCYKAVPKPVLNPSVTHLVSHPTSFTTLSPTFFTLKNTLRSTASSTDHACGPWRSAFQHIRVPLRTSCSLHAV